SIGGPLQSDTQKSVPISNDIQDSAKLHVFWGGVQGLHIGFFIAIGALVAFWLIMNRTTLGFGIRAVGYNPEAARYSGIDVARNYFIAMAISGMLPGLRGRDRHPGLGVPVRADRHPGVGDRLRRHRSRPSGPQHGRGHLLLRAPLR